MKQELLTYLEGFITESRKERFLDVISRRTNHFTLAMEDVFQMHNTSAVVRTCEVFGVQQAHIVEERFGKRLDAKIAMGAQKWVDIFRYEDTQSCLQSLRSKGYQIVATSPHKEAFSLETFDISKKSVFFFGTEKDGLSQEVLSTADTFLTIPMVGFTESLNISVSAAIILQQLTSRLRSSQVDWRLSEEEKTDILIAWMKKSIRNIDYIMQRYKGAS
ncbi:tRNA (guanosine-2'-O-)-methyltransferase [Capnocytophaga haemolytica]|uniref:tRNA (guanosine(18)-2'-O)-methyltransferase n=1 Tax=Capnocytophaga haemolytica TaxID=45243 RepID=A0AAX2GYM3_9FLAO|nr:RNA methyltransferase [Capnocytophaga haemolytica]AMD84835.1 rRNA methyltransferase [Capnocytophaga haemolytica]SFN75898.1 tRNA (guanosine-2'-O-)-methyltransferase [Capnocytophaga haemolytica]SNV06959.1 tRNA (guanosine(18)-2'-O)-methyltransferase [Capnocytophaga haemolytica]